MKHLGLLVIVALIVQTSSTDDSCYINDEDIYVKDAQAFARVEIHQGCFIGRARALPGSGPTASWLRFAFDCSSAMIKVHGKTKSMTTTRKIERHERICIDPKTVLL